LLQGQDLTIPITIDRQNLTSPAPMVGQALTTCGESSTDKAENLTSSGQDLPAVEHFLTSEQTKLNRDGTKFNALKTFKTNHQSIIKKIPDHQEQILPAITDGTCSPINQWQIEEILFRAGAGKKLRQIIFRASEENLLSFIGWLLFALSLPKIQYPVFFAYKRFRENTPPQPFLQLAKIPAAQCYQWLVGHSGGIPPDLIKTVSDLRKQDSHLKLLEIGAIPSSLASMFAVEQKDGGDSPARGEDIDQRSVSSLAGEMVKVPPALEHAWNNVYGRLQAEVDRSIFDTWVRDIEVMGVRGETMFLGVANDYARQWLEVGLKETIEQSLLDILGETVRVRFVVLDEISR
jgi:hypothetical protein